MNWKLRSAYLAVSIALAVAIGACGSTSTPAGAKGTITVGGFAFSEGSVLAELQALTRLKELHLFLTAPSRMYFVTFSLKTAGMYFDFSDPGGLQIRMSSSFGFAMLSGLV